MEKIDAVVIEDEFAIAEDISSKLALSGYNVAGIFDSAESALPFIVETTPDIILVDIRLRGAMDGIWLVEQLQKKINVPVVYVTANSDATTYERARKTRPHAFLVKPFTPANLLAAIDLALYHYSVEKTPDAIEQAVADIQREAQVFINQSLFVKVNGRYKKVQSDDILFIEASGSYVNVQTIEDRYTLSQNLAHFQKKTPLPNLIRIHRSFIVNISRVESFEESFVFIKNYKLPMSDNFKADFNARIHCM